VLLAMWPARRRRASPASATRPSMPAWSGA